MNIRSLILALGAAVPAFAGSITGNFTGTFSVDNQIQLFEIDLATPGNISVYTTSYADGGFGTHLELFDGTGQQQAQSDGGEPACNDATPPGPAPVRPAGPGQGCGDSWVHEGPTASDLESAGTYFVSLSQNGNGSLGNLSDPFFWNGGVEPSDPNYTATFGCPDSGYFCNLFSLQHDTGNWDVTFVVSSPDGIPDATVTELSSTPEPASLALLLAGLAGVLYVRRSL